MAYVLHGPVAGQLTDEVHSAARNPIGMETLDAAGRTWRYMKGIGSTVEGSWVTYDEASVTALLAANAKGPVAVAGGAIVADKFGWYCVLAPGSVRGLAAASSAADAFVGRETADGSVGDGRATGDEIFGVMQRTANTSAGLTDFQIFARPFVTDANGA